jgi:hypothetical protein
MIVMFVDLSTIDQTDPRRVRWSLKMLPILQIDLHDPICVRDGDSELPAWFENLVPTTENG